MKNLSILYTLPIFLVFLVFSIIFGNPWYRHQSDIYGIKNHLEQQQKEIFSMAENLVYVNDKLSEMLKQISAPRAMVVMLTSNFNSVPVLERINTINSLTQPGHKPAVIANSFPVYQWRDFLIGMKEHKCTYILSNDITDFDARIRFSSYSYSLLFCPIFSSNDKIIGNLEISWDKQEDVPSKEGIEETKKIMMSYAKDIGYKLTSELVNY